MVLFIFKLSDKLEMIKAQLSYTSPFLTPSFLWKSFASSCDHHHPCPPSLSSEMGYAVPKKLLKAKKWVAPPPYYNLIPSVILGASISLTKNCPHAAFLFVFVSVLIGYLTMGITKGRPSQDKSCSLIKEKA